MADDTRIISEDEIIRDFLRPLAEGCDAALDLRDDAACLIPRSGTELVMTNDALVAGVHFRAEDHAVDIGFKAAATNVSDLVAKGAEPIGFVMTLALPDTPTRRWMADLCSGLGDWVRGKLMGGDLVRTPGPLTISITAIGEVPAGTMVRRTTAKPGDLVYVTGVIGDAMLGLKHLLGSAEFATIMTTANIDQLTTAYLRPDPPTALTGVIRDFASAAMDISDGLVRDAIRMCTSSSVGMKIDASKVPISTAAEKLISAGIVDIQACFTGGDDYQTLMTVPEHKISAFEAAVAVIPAISVTRIGHVTDAVCELIVRDAGGQPMVFDKTGHDHF